MAGIETDLVDTLEAVALAAGRVWPRTWPQDATWPGLTYQLIADTPELALNRAVGSWRARFQVDCWALSTADAVTLYGQVKAALLAMTGAAVRIIGLGIEDGAEMPEPATELIRRRLEVVIRYV